jgi:hypothetical protein
MGEEVVAHRIGADFPGLHTESLCYIANSEPIDEATASERLLRVAPSYLDGRYTDPTGPDVLSDRPDPEIRVERHESSPRAAPSPK